MPEPKKLFEKRWDRYGLSEDQWNALEPIERVTHYNRHLPDKDSPKANIAEWPIDLVDSFSHDPYAHTVHGTETE
jgi:hypothetical protein